MQGLLRSHSIQICILDISVAETRSEDMMRSNCNRCKDDYLMAHKRLISRVENSDNLAKWDVETLMQSKFLNKLSKGCWGCDLGYRYRIMGLAIVMQKLGVRI